MTPEDISSYASKLLEEHSNLADKEIGYVNYKNIRKAYDRCLNDLIVLVRELSDLLVEKEK